MTRAGELFLIVTVFLIASCSTKVSKSVHYPPGIVAWYEDTINSFQITLMPNMNFYYAIVKKEDDERFLVKSFKGTYQLSSDSIWLHYDKNLYSPQTTDYIVKEVSGNYLIQYFINSPRKMYLRIQKENHRF